MAINIIVGRPGGGKSYESVAYHILPALKSGRKVITNVPLNLDHFKKIFGDEVLDLIDVRKDSFDKDVGQILAFSKAEHFTNDDWKNDDGQGPLFVVDECHFVYPRTGRDKQKSSYLIDCLEYFSMHRHYGHDILLMTQSMGKLNRDLKDMIEIRYQVSKMTALGSDKRYIKKVFQGADSRGAEVNSEIRKYEKKIFPFYKSHTQSEGSVNEASAKDIQPFWKSKTVIGSLTCLILFIYLAFNGGLNVFGTKTDDKPVDTVSKKDVELKSIAVSNSNSSNRPAITVKNISHPFQNFELMISGNYRGGFYDAMGSFHEDIRIYMDMVKNGSVVGELEEKDLLLAGYDVTNLGDCLIKVKYGDYENFITCDKPQPKQEKLI